MVKRVLMIAAGGVFAAICVLCLFLPFPKERSSEREYYTCRWENGAVTTESFYTAYAALTGAEERIVLTRDGLKGEIEAGEEYRRVRETLERGTLAQMLSLKVGALSGVERAALWKRYSGLGYYSEEFFAWNGENVFRAEERAYEEVFLLTGDLSAGLLKRTGAKKLIVHGESDLTAKGLVGSLVTEAEARYPYYERDGAIYLKTAGGVRLIAALPYVTELTVDCDFLDEGALSPCMQLKRLTLPEKYEGGLARLFGEQTVPDVELK